jgi:hypothetical protein
MIQGTVLRITAFNNSKRVIIDKVSFNGKIFTYFEYAKEHDCEKDVIEHKAEHDNLYVITSDQLFLEFMEVCIDELKELSNSIEKLNEKVSKI